MKAGKGHGTKRTNLRTGGSAIWTEGTNLGTEGSHLKTKGSHIRDKETVGREEGSSHIQDISGRCWK